MSHTLQAKVAFHEYYQHTDGCVIVICIPAFKTFRMLISLHIMIFFKNTVLFKAVVGRKIEINVQEENSESFQWGMWEF